MVNRYAVKVINPDTGVTVWFNGWICSLCPQFTNQRKHTAPFLQAHANAQQLKRCYPMVKVVGVHE